MMQETSQNSQHLAQILYVMEKQNSSSRGEKEEFKLSPQNQNKYFQVTLILSAACKNLHLLQAPECLPTGSWTCTASISGICPVFKYCP